MTCIIGLKTKDEIWMGSDTAASGGGIIFNMAQSKTFVRGGVIVSYTGYVRPGQVLQYSYDWPRVKGDIDDWLYNQFIPGWQQALRNAGNLSVSEEQVTQDAHFLIGVGGRLYSMHQQFEVIEVADDYACDGCGQEVAYGVLYATKNKKMRPQDRIQLALEAASYHLEGVRGPFNIGRVKNKLN